MVEQYEEKGYIITRQIQDPRIHNVVTPHIVRIGAVFIGLFIGLLALSLFTFPLKEGTEGFVEWIMNAFPPEFQLLGLLIAIVLFVFLVFGVQLIVTWLIVRFLSRIYSKTIIRTDIQHRVARILKYFGGGIFLVIFLASSASPFFTWYLSGDFVLIIWVCGALILITIYLGTSLGQLFTDVLFYYYYQQKEK